MDVALDALSWFALSAGAFFCVVGAVGLVRLPDFYARSHASGVTDTLGLPLILLGCALQAGPSLVTVKLGFILFFVFVTGPTAAHALVKSAYRRGVTPILDRDDPAGTAPGPRPTLGEVAP